MSIVIHQDCVETYCDPLTLINSSLPSFLKNCIILGGFFLCGSIALDADFHGSNPLPSLFQECGTSSSYYPTLFFPSNIHCILPVLKYRS